MGDSGWCGGGGGGWEGRAGEGVGGDDAAVAVAEDGDGAVGEEVEGFFADLFRGKDGWLVRWFWCLGRCWWGGEGQRRHIAGEVRSNLTKRISSSMPAGGVRLAFDGRSGQWTSKPYDCNSVVSGA